MSKRDIELVTTLAAHLAYVTAWQVDSPTVLVKVTRKAEDCAADAMRLQRLGRSARNAERRRWAKQGNGPETADKALEYVKTSCASLLTPYGLTAEIKGDYLAGPILHILGLPANTDAPGGFVI